MDKPVFEKVVDVLPIFINYFNSVQCGLSPGAAIFSPSDCVAAMHYLEGLWQQYEIQAISAGQPLLWQNEYKQRIYRDIFTALTISYFDTARVLFSMSYKNTLHCDTSEEAITRLCSSIIAGAVYLETKGNGCALVRQSFPLAVVAMCSPSDAQRDVARLLFIKWRKAGTMRGLNHLALDMIQDASISTLSNAHH
jgi:hypothetical protein